MNRPTRFYSKKQENKVASDLGGKRTPNSGATKFIKGDVTTEDFLIECKTVTKPQEQFTIKKSWIAKNKEEKRSMGKLYSAIAFDFGDGGQTYYVIDQDLFRTLLNSLKED